MQKRKAQGPRCARAMRNKGWRSKTIMSKSRQIPCEVKGSIRNLQGPCRLRGSIAPVKVENCKYHGIWAAVAPKIFKHHVEQQFFQHKATRHRSPQGLRIHNSVSKIELNAMELAKTCLREQTQSIHVTRYCIEHLHGIIWSNFKGREGQCISLNFDAWKIEKSRWHYGKKSFPASWSPWLSQRKISGPSSCYLAASCGNHEGKLRAGRPLNPRNTSCDLVTLWLNGMMLR